MYALYKHDATNVRVVVTWELWLLRDVVSHFNDEAERSLQQSTGNRIAAPTHQQSYLEFLGRRLLQRLF